MSEVIFPTWITNWTPATDDRILFSDTSASNATKDCAISELPISTATQAAIDVVQADVDAHEARTDNPHSVTKSQVWLGNADNTSDVDKPISTATQTALDTKQPDIQFKDQWINIGTSGWVTAINFTGNIITATESGWVVTVDVSWPWTGDVLWPASSTDNAIARYDSTTGKIIQDSSVTIDDSANIDWVASLQFTWGTGTQGTVSWNNDEETLDLIQNGATLQLWQEIQWHCRNNTGVLIPNGTPVMATGTIGNSGRITIATMASTVKANARYYLGIATEDIADWDDGKITHFWKVRWINTTWALSFGWLETWNDWDVLYLDTAHDGYLTKVEPTTWMNIPTAYVIHSHANWTIAVRVNTSDLNILAEEIKYDNTTSDLAATNVQDAIDEIDNLFYVSQEPTGFPTDQSTWEIDLTSSVVTFDDGTRTLTVAPTGASFDFFVNWHKFTKSTPQTVTITDTEWTWFFYFDETGTLVTTQTFDAGIIYKNAYCAEIYWDATNNTAIHFWEERHGVKMDWHTHIRLHLKDGTIYVSGCALNTFSADWDGSLAAHAQFGADAWVIRDEDIRENLSAITSTTGFPVFYRDWINGYWRRQINAGYPILTTGTGRMAYNNPDAGGAGVWGLSEITTAQFGLTHIFATNDKNYPYFSIMGQADYSTITAARTAANTAIWDLITSWLPFQEFVPVGTIIYQTSAAYTNAVKSRVRTTDTGGNYVDFRAAKISASSLNIGSHNSLAGLQGGTAWEYYHATSAEYTVLQNTSGTNTWDQNTFSTIAVSWQSNVVADSTTDTLTLAAGTGISITTDASTDTVTITNTWGWAATAVTVADESADTTCFPLFVTAATWDLWPKTNSGMTYNSSTGAFWATSVSVSDDAYGAGWNGSTQVPTKNAVYDKIESISTALSTWYTLSNVTTDRTLDANATSIDELADVLWTVINDMRTYVWVSAKQIRITIPWELIADTSNYQWLFWYNDTWATITISNVAFTVAKAAAWTWAAAAFNVYKSSGTAADGINTNAVNLFTSAVDLTTSYTSLTNTPNTTTVESGRYVSLRVTSSAGATNKANDAQVIITYS